MDNGLVDIFDLLVGGARSASGSLLLLLLLASLSSSFTPKCVTRELCFTIRSSAAFTQRRFVIPATSTGLSSQPALGRWRSKTSGEVSGELSAIVAVDFGVTLRSSKTFSLFLKVSDSLKIYSSAKKRDPRSQVNRPWL